MVQEVASVVAEVTAEKEDFERGMQEVSTEIEKTSDRTQKSQQAQQEEIGQTNFLIGRTRAALLGLGAVGVATFGSLIRNSSLFQAHMQQVEVQADLLGNELVRALDLEDFIDASADGMRALRKEIRETRREAEARGGDLPFTPDFIEAPFERTLEGAMERDVDKVVSGVEDLILPLVRGPGQHFIIERSEEPVANFVRGTGNWIEKQFKNFAGFRG